MKKEKSFKSLSNSRPFVTENGKSQKGKHEGLSRYKLKGFSSIKDNTRWLSQPTKKLRSQWRLRKAMTRSHFHGRSFYWFTMLHAHTHNHVWHIGDHLTLKMLPLLSALMLSPFSSIEAHISAWQWRKRSNAETFSTWISLISHTQL